MVRREKASQSMHSFELHVTSVTQGYQERVVFSVLELPQIAQVRRIAAELEQELGLVCMFRGNWKQ